MLNFNYEKIELILEHPLFLFLKKVCLVMTYIVEVIINITFCTSKNILKH